MNQGELFKDLIDRYRQAKAEAAASPGVIAERHNTFVVQCPHCGWMGNTAKRGIMEQRYQHHLNQFHGITERS